MSKEEYGWNRRLRARVCTRGLALLNYTFYARVLFTMLKYQAYFLLSHLYVCELCVCVCSYFLRTLVLLCVRE